MTDNGNDRSAGEATWPPAPPQGAVRLALETTPPAVTRAEDDQLRSIDERFKPLRGDLYRLAPGADARAVSRHYDAILPGWDAASPVESRGDWRRDWRHEGRLVSVALVTDIQTADAASGPVLIVQHTRR